MKHYRVITDLRGIHRLQARNPILFWRWHDIATGLHRQSLDDICARMESDI
jgi:hypothetical protein